jgi:hypothetical protein
MMVGMSVSAVDPDRAADGRALPQPRTCAEDVLWLLAAHGVEFLFLNPGTDSAPLQEAAAALEERAASRSTAAMVTSPATAPALALK